MKLITEQNAMQRLANGESLKTQHPAAVFGRIEYLASCTTNPVGVWYDVFNNMNKYIPNVEELTAEEVLYITHKAGRLPPGLNAQKLLESLEQSVQKVIVVLNN